MSSSLATAALGVLRSTCNEDVHSYLVNSLQFSRSTFPKVLSLVVLDRAVLSLGNVVNTTEVSKTIEIGPQKHVDTASFFEGFPLQPVRARELGHSAGSPGASRKDIVVENEGGDTFLTVSDLDLVVNIGECVGVVFVKNSRKMLTGDPRGNSSCQLQILETRLIIPKSARLEQDATSNHHLPGRLTYLLHAPMEGPRDVGVDIDAFAPACYRWARLRRTPTIQWCGVGPSRRSAICTWLHDNYVYDPQHYFNFTCENTGLTRKLATTGGSSSTLLVYGKDAWFHCIRELRLIFGTWHAPSMESVVGDFFAKRIAIDLEVPARVRFAPLEKRLLLDQAGTWLGSESPVNDHDRYFAVGPKIVSGHQHHDFHSREIWKDSTTGGDAINGRLVPTDIGTLCPFTHLSGSGTTGSTHMKMLNTEREWSERTPCSGSFNNSTKFHVIPFPVPRGRLFAKDHPEDPSVHSQRPRADRLGAPSFFHDGVLTSKSKKPKKMLDLLYTGNHLGALQQLAEQGGGSIFLPPEETASHKSRRVHPKTTGLTADETQEEKVSKKHPLLEFHIVGSDQGFYSPAEPRAYLSRGILPQFHRTMSYIEKISLVAQARVCFVHNVVVIEEPMVSSLEALLFARGVAQHNVCQKADTGVQRAPGSSPRSSFQNATGGGPEHDAPNDDQEGALSKNGQAEEADAVDTDIRLHGAGASPGRGVRVSTTVADHYVHARSFSSLRRGPDQHGGKEMSAEYQLRVGESGTKADTATESPRSKRQNVESPIYSADEHKMNADLHGLEESTRSTDTIHDIFRDFMKCNIGPRNYRHTGACTVDDAGDLDERPLSLEKNNARAPPSRSRTRRSQRRSWRYLPQVKSRMFEAAQNRCLMAVMPDPWNLIEMYFKPDQDFVYVGSPQELVDLARKARQNFTVYSRIVASAYRQAEKYSLENFRASVAHW